MKAYEYRHLVGFAETNVVGNVYFSHHVAWQGRCREAFLREHCPSLLDELTSGLALVTLSCRCEYVSEVLALEEVIVRMTLAESSQNRVAMRFDYVVVRDGTERIVARGGQEIACMRRTAGGLEATSVPVELSRALEPYRSR